MFFFYFLCLQFLFQHFCVYALCIGLLIEIKSLGYDNIIVFFKYNFFKLFLALINFNKKIEIKYINL